jgi:dipeptidyl aminopeptidase/acylaminoacyl peptidase
MQLLPQPLQPKQKDSKKKNPSKAKYTMTRLLLVLYLFSTVVSQAQLTVEKIMKDPKWIGSSPSAPVWSADGQQLFFRWNPTNDKGDSLYVASLGNLSPQKAKLEQLVTLEKEGSYQYNENRTALVYAFRGDIYYQSGNTKRRITQTIEIESNPQFSFQEKKIVYTRNQQLFAWDIQTGETQQLAQIKTVNNPASLPSSGGPVAMGSNPSLPRTTTTSEQEQWLQKDQLQYLQVLRERKTKKEETEAYNKLLPKEKELRSIPLEERTLLGYTISPDGRFIVCRLFRNPAAAGKATIVPNYVTESGFTTDLTTRTKVGAPNGTVEVVIFDRTKDTVYNVLATSLPGMHDEPDFWKDYAGFRENQLKKKYTRKVSITNVVWSPKSQYALLDIRANDNKDRWLMAWDTASTQLKLVDRQRDEAWVGGPGIIGFGSSVTGWLDETRCWFRSEATGYSHLYTVDLRTSQRTALTAGNYEVQQAFLSLNKKYFYITTNEAHPGEQHFYHLRIADGKKERITLLPGAHQVKISPDEKNLAILYSNSVTPWELFWMENKPGAKQIAITDKGKSEAFRAVNWIEPTVISFPAADGAMVYARVYEPKNPDPKKPAILFVHGAGYLQNAHKWWSTYFREFMFNNLLAEKGYYVMDIDYRGSAGYGRDLRTGIYRHMGGKDLSDHVDAVNYMVKKYGVDPKRIGIYGGSYGGFITLMGLFTAPNTFAAGAALRPVTDWANYNHGYTSNILNEPFTDSIAYRRSSPLYFAEGLQGNLLICHGMIDVNVHYQDVVKLTQRLIELGKDNWELASYPLEDHGFVEPSSWTDEYKRILKLFETTLKK